MKVQTKKIINNKPVDLLKDFPQKKISFYYEIQDDEVIYMVKGDEVLFRFELSASSGETSFADIDIFEV